MAFNWGSSGGSSGFNFGSSSAQKPASTGFSFGTNNNAGSGTGTGGSGFSFGGSNTASSGSGGFSFGSSGTGAGAAAGTGSGFSFGSGSGGSGFGSGFGSTNTASNSSSGFNFSSSAPSNPSGTPAFVTGSTKFSDLPENYKSVFLELEKAFRKESNLRSELAESMNSPPPTADLKSEIASLNQRLSDLSVSIEKELLSLNSFETFQNQEIRHCESAIRTLNKLLNHQNPALVSASETIYLPSPYHWNKLDEFQQRMEEMQAIMDQLEDYIAANEGNWNSNVETMKQADQMLNQASELSSQPKSLTTVLQFQHHCLLHLTGRWARVHQGVEALKSAFLTRYGRAGSKFLDKVEMEQGKREKMMENLEKNAMQIVSQLAAEGNNNGQNAAANQNKQNGTAPAAAGGAPAGSGTGGFSFGASTGSGAGGSTGGFSFGGSNAAAPASNSGGFSFGASSAPSAGGGSSGFSFGSPSANTGSSATGFSFGLNNNSSATKPRSGVKTLGKK